MSRDCNIVNLSGKHLLSLVYHLPISFNTTFFSVWGKCQQRWRRRQSTKLHLIWTSSHASKWMASVLCVYALLVFFLPLLFASILSDIIIEERPQYHVKLHHNYARRLDYMVCWNTHCSFVFYTFYQHQHHSQLCRWVRNKNPFLALCYSLLFFFLLVLLLSRLYFRRIFYFFLALCCVIIC